GIWPDRYTVRPLRTACEYGPMAAGASPVLIALRVMARSVGCRSGRGARNDSPRSEALHAVHRAEPPDAADHVGQVLAVADLDREAHHGDVGVALEVLDAVDVRLGLRDGGGHLRQHAGPVVHLDAQRRVEVAGHLAVPADGQ